MEVLGSEEFLRTIGNNVLWLLIVPASTVVIGLLVAVLADRLAPKGEAVSKALIFMPMAISFVGASTIWASSTTTSRETPRSVSSTPSSSHSAASPSRGSPSTSGL
ncbi:hypothetical protein [Tessaracoccus aquimaris]|uniref:hypothetical protein n=1 Tax=Tessaracoccus aquimaris TaxID=1332264 RepID=UPI001D056791|nr:hypothetical protein [Tessaracoccus aquimaris]